MTRHVIYFSGKQDAKVLRLAKDASRNYLLGKQLYRDNSRQ